MFTVKIAKGDSTIASIIDLRYKILREPWNKPKETVTDELELFSVNAFIEQNHKIIACGRLQNNGNGIGQVRYMAVDKEFQGKGFGKLILEKLEIEARHLKMNKIELQARENALNFYQKNGYSLLEKSFVLWDIIPHYLMVKTINDEIIG